MAEAAINHDSRESNGPPVSRRGRIPELDGLRGIAIAMVVTHHYFLEPIQAPRATWLYYVQASGRLAFSGLDLFFVLSGFLIGGILLDARDSSNYFRVFYTRRLFRIVPVYAVLLFGAFSVFLLGSLGAGNRLTWLFQGRLPWVPHLVFLQNFWMAKANTFGPAVLGLTWTLAVEEQFYLTLPFLVRFLSSRHLVFILFGGVLAAPILRIAVHVLWPRHELAWYVMMPCRADALLLGVLGAVALRNPRWRLRLQGSRQVLLCALVVLAFGFALLTKLWGALTFGVLTIGLTWLATFYLCVLLNAVIYKDSWLSRCLRWRWLMGLGSIAYGMYLFHQFVAYVLFAVVWGRSPGPLSWSRLCVSVSALVVTLILCRLSWVYFEKPLVLAAHKTNYEWRHADVNYT
jgi:peptidoglycan/LPS O-acetylase OafA/YrhL